MFATLLSSFIVDEAPFKRTMSLPVVRFAARVTFPLNRAKFPFTSSVPAVNETFCAVVPEIELMYKSPAVPFPIVIVPLPAFKVEVPEIYVSVLNEIAELVVAMVPLSCERPVPVFANPFVAVICEPDFK